MAYRIFFSGLVVYVEHKDFSEVDVLLLNPCAGHHHSPGEGEHEQANHERECLDRHLPQLTVRAADIAEWNFAGTLHGCGSHHFDLTGKTVYPAGKRGGIAHNQRPALDTYNVDPFGDMQHVSFREGIVDMDDVIGDGQIDADKVTGLLRMLGKDLIATRIRLPQGTLTALAPVDNSVRQVVRWKIGPHVRSVVGETVMFEASDDAAPRINVGENGEFVALRNKPNVAVWISCEPRVRTQFQPELGFRGAPHFEHYYSLLPKAAVTAAATTDGKTDMKTLQPQLVLAANIDTPFCPPSLMHRRP